MKEGNIIQKKALFFDLDGTLLNSDSTISPELAYILKKWRSLGNYIFAVSGRSLRKFKLINTPFSWDGYVLHNGSIVSLFDKILYRRQIPYGQVINFLEKIRSRSLFYGVETDNCFFSNFDKINSLDKNSFPLHDFYKYPPQKADKLIVLGEHLDDLEDIIHPNLIKVVMDSSFTCITHKFANKLIACKKIINCLKLKKKNCFYFGNDENDREALEYFYHSIIIGPRLLNIKNKNAIFYDTNDKIVDYIRQKIKKEGI